MLKVGDSIPEFKLKDQSGNLFDSQSIIGKKPCVIYFYPKDFTPGCTLESCGFRDRYEEFVEKGVIVIGISSDSVTRHRKFSDFLALPFSLLSDPCQIVQKKFGLKAYLFGILSQRITFVINKEGVLVRIYKNNLAKGHIEASLKAIISL
tara:strand:+ start:1790 stop:2239 length:450 start_codon:yes stop_codon:yes gene_type:complete